MLVNAYIISIGTIKPTHFASGKLSAKDNLTTQETRIEPFQNWVCRLDLQ
jgi:hypothetical protein